MKHLINGRISHVLVIITMKVKKGFKFIEIFEENSAIFYEEKVNI